MYNGASYIAKAIGSILNQTFYNFELLIINDGSIDESEKVIKEFKDDRIRYFSFGQNRGLVSSLNFGIEKAQGKYIARIDADDISAPNRLEKQVKFLDNSPEYVLIGSSVELIPSGKIKIPPLTHQEIGIGLGFNNVFFHSTMIFRSILVKNHGLRYKKEYLGCEDYKLWTEAIAFGKAGNLLIHGMKYRIHSNQISKNKSQELNSRLNLIRENYLIDLGIRWNSEAWTIFHHFCNSEEIEKTDIQTLIASFSDLSKKFAQKFGENSDQILDKIFSVLLLRIPNRKFTLTSVYKVFLRQLGIRNSRVRFKLAKQDIKFFLKK